MSLTKFIHSNKGVNVKREETITNNEYWYYVKNPLYLKITQYQFQEIVISNYRKS